MNYSGEEKLPFTKVETSDSPRLYVGGAIWFEVRVGLRMGEIF